MTTTADGYTPQDWTGRLSPSDVHHVLFARARLGRRGYDEVEVDGFLERVQQELTRLISEKADLRDEVSRLKSQLAQAGAAAPVADGALSHEEANLQAVRLLAAAQQTADVYVADAEKYSQRLTIDAREHSEQMLEEARRAARTMLAEAERVAHDAASRTIDGEVVRSSSVSKEELDQQVAYLQTFGQVVRVQLRAYLEALLRDVEDEWGRADPAAVKGVGELGGSGSGSGGAGSGGAGSGGAGSGGAGSGGAGGEASPPAPEPRTASALGSGPDLGVPTPPAGRTTEQNGRKSAGRPRTSTTVSLP